MSWRNVQLNGQLCDQDQLIISLFDGSAVNYVGTDSEFRKNLTHQPTATSLVLILNRPVWVRDIESLCQQYLLPHVETFYIGINRYQVQGNNTVRKINNTEHHGSDLIHLLKELAQEQGFSVTRSGHFDHDQGRYFNFVQPLTWIYGHKITI